MGFAKSADQVKDLIKKKISLNDIFSDIQNNTEIVLQEYAPPPGQRPTPSGKRSPFMFIGQNPAFNGTTDGRYEEGQELKFFEDKKLGKWINKICEYIGLQRSDVYVTNALKYPTLKNEEPYFKDGKIHMRHFFFNEILIIKPEIIFVMGKWTQKLFEKMFHFEMKDLPQKVTLSLTIENKEIEYETYIYPIHHPSYVERSNDFSLYEKQLEPILDLMDKIKIDWKYVHLHCHNSHSMKDGVGIPETRIQYAVDNGKPAVATSNHGTISDWLNIYNGCKSNGLKPILGCEFYFNRYGEDLQSALNEDTQESVQKRKELKKKTTHFTAFTKNLTGYYNMIKIHNDAWVNRFYRNPITAPEIIEKNKDGIIVLSGCSGAEQNKVISEKFYFLSDQRKNDIDILVENKLKSMKALMRSGSEEKYWEDEYLDEWDFDYFRTHKEEKFDEKEYTLLSVSRIEQLDKDKIENADSRAREIVDWWHNVFGDDYYIEVMVIDYPIQRLINQELIKIAKEKNIPIVLTNDAHYINQSEAEVQQLQMLNDQDKTFEDLKNDVEGKIWTIKSKDLYYKSVEELYDSWLNYGHKSDIFTEEIFWEGINNAIKLVDSVEDFTIDKTNKLPKLYDDSIQALAQKVSEGMKKRGLAGNTEYEQRAAFEFKVVVRKGFADYFLILNDIINWTKNKFGRFSCGPGRGSAAGSLINFVLEITDVDPIRHGLMFERFLDIARADAVDIDSDFEPRIRDAVIDYMVQRFGSEYVSAIGTFGITRTKVAIQDTARVFGIPAQETLTLTKLLKDADDDAPLEDLENEFPELKKYLDKWQQQGHNLRYYINGIRNAHRNISQHAAGVLVSSDKLIDNVALVQSRKRIVTGWQEGSDYHELSDLGYYKYDILGLNNLQVVNDAHSLVKKRRGIDIDWDSIDLDEDFVYKNVVHNHDHYGCFQFESNLARKLMKDIMPDNFDELSAVSSLLRPGPLRMGMHTEFADRKHGRKVEGKDYEIPECIRDILGSTYGVIIYQEQFMKIANKIGGLDNKEVNAFRKALVKYGKGAEQEAKRYEQVASYHDKFIDTASKPEFLGDRLKAEELWQLIASFATYGFNLSHSISYTYTSFREYWLKAHYDSEFNVALLNNTSKGKESRGESVISQYITEILKKGYKVLPPSINISEGEFSLKSNTEIVWGLKWVKNLPDDTINTIIKERDEHGVFSDLNDFFTRVGKSSLNKRAVEALVWSGSLDDYTLSGDPMDRFDLHEKIYIEYKKDKSYKPENATIKSLIEKEIEYNNISMTELKFFVDVRKQLEEATGSVANYLYEVDSQGTYFVVGKVEKVENKKTKTKKDYKRVSLRDETSLLRGVFLWPWKCKNSHDIKVGTIIAAKIEHDGNFINLTNYQRTDREDEY